MKHITCDVCGTVKKEYREQYLEINVKWRFVDKIGDQNQPYYYR